MPTYKVRRVRKRRRFTRRRRVGRRVPTISRIGRSVFAFSSYNMHAYKVKANLGPLTITAPNQFQGFAYTFSLDQLPNYLELTALYDQYMLRFIKLYIVARSTNMSYMETINAPKVGTPQLICVVDYDDAGIPASSEAGMNSIREYSRSRSFIYGTGKAQTFKIGLKPATLSMAWRTAVSTAYSPKWNQYVDCDNANMQHFGLKGVLHIPVSPGGALPADVLFDVFATFYVNMKTTR